MFVNQHNELFYVLHLSLGEKYLEMSLKIFPLFSLCGLQRYTTTVRAGAWSLRQESITSTEASSDTASGPLYSCTHYHCTPGKVHFTVCAQILQFCNVTVFIWFCVETCSHTIKYCH